MRKTPENKQMPAPNPHGGGGFGGPLPKDYSKQNEKAQAEHKQATDDLHKKQIGEASEPQTEKTEGENEQES